MTHRTISMPRTPSPRSLVLACALLSLAFCWCAAAPPGTDSAGPPVSVKGQTNVTGRCKIVAVVPNPNVPSPERPAVFVGTADQPLESIARPDMLVPPGRHVRVYHGGSALLELSTGTRILLAEDTDLRVDRSGEDASFWLYLQVGAARLLGLSADKTLMQSPAAVATRHQTDFEMRVQTNGLTEVTAFEGVVNLTNELGSVILNGALISNRATVAVGSAPLAALRATNLVQWWLHFPVVLDPTELNLASVADADVQASFAEYASGRFAEAVARYPKSRVPTESSERVYAAALRLLAGDLPGAESLLSAITGSSEQASALRLLIAAVRHELVARPFEASTASGEMALSYWCQARHDLAGALQAARRAVARSPRLMAAWARITELELGREDLRAAARSQQALKELAPDHALTLMLEGFLEIARNRTAAAHGAFEAALARDPSLADAWLGLGLVRMREGQRKEGLAAFETAVALEPERSVCRSYLAKALLLNRRETNAWVQLRQAELLDPADPTP
jgi:tetratricopeptide (TPR) repeat protein